jgi:transcriptional regulator PpsR
MRWLPHGMAVQPPSMADLQPLFSEALGHSPDGFVLTDNTGVIKIANEKWMSMLGVADSSQLYGQPLENCLARGNVDWGVLLTILRSQTVVKDFAAELRGLTGSTIAVEISARTLSTDQTYYAFYVRDMERIQTKESSIVAIGMENSVAGLSELVGLMPMHDIVGETVDMIEKKCIQTALELTRNNRASAAQMLGLSRQSLYVKLRRFGMISDVEVRGLTD